MTTAGGNNYQGESEGEGFNPGVRRYDEGLPLNPTPKQSRDSLPNPEMEQQEIPSFFQGNLKSIF